MKNPVLMLVVIIAVLVALAVGKDMIIKTAVEKGVQAVTGLPLSMKSFNLGILSTKVGIKGLMLYNPKGFPDKTMLNAPEIYVDYDLGAMIGGTVHLREARINIEEFTVVKNANG
ncbi:MAG: hypothetical protein NTV07_05630, partial [Candidatus Omnitrophica bacterium]|nr:hypothetical protein [Candidatus Omnitrophota bacterium]